MQAWHEIPMLGKERPKWQTRWWYVSRWLGLLAAWTRRTGKRIAIRIDCLSVLAAARHIYLHRVVRSEKWADFKIRAIRNTDDEKGGA